LLNPNASGSVPLNQSISGSMDTAASAAVLSLANTPVLVMNWYCPVTQQLTNVVFAISLLGLTVASLKNQLSTSLSKSSEETFINCTAGSTGEWSFWMNGLDTWAYVLSGVYSGSIVVNGYSGNQVGASTDFLLKVYPAIPPITILTIPLMVIVVFELYAIVKDFLALNKLRPGNRRMGGNPPPATGTPPQNYPQAQAPSAAVATRPYPPPPAPPPQNPAQYPQQPAQGQGGQ
jgi:hypothetical protein